MFDILTLVPGRKRLTPSGWYSFNAICCHHRGHRPDTKGRGGVIKDGDNWTYACFNCGFKCGFTLGQTISEPTRLFMSWCGVDQNQILKYNLDSLRNKDLIEYVKVKKKKIKFEFKEQTLPDGELIDVNNPLHKVYVDYLNKRKINLNDYPFMVTPNEEGRQANRIIIPYTYKGKIVGYTSRFLDNRIPRYINVQQPGYVFGIDFQKRENQFCILVEGIFDALSLNGCALMHNAISQDQQMMLSQLNRPIIFVPDQDETGLEMCEQALELGYKVSIPNWADDVKDVNDAVVKYGKLATLLSIIQSATNSKIKVDMQRRKLGK